MIIEFEGKIPLIGKNVFIEETARILGDVVIGDESSVWFYTVIRGDVHSIRIGARTNIQDLTMVHVTNGKFSTTIGDEVSIAHHVTVHGCVIEDRCLIGIGAVVLDGAKIGPDCIVAAGSLVTPGFQSTPGTMIMGSPAKTVRVLREDELQMIRNNAQNYVQYSVRYRHAYLK